MVSGAKYDRIGIRYNETRRADPRIVSLISDQLGTIGNGPVLDIGCGTGNYTNALNRSGLDMIGVDPSRHMLTMAEQSSNAILWLEGSADRIPLKDNSVAGVLAMLTIHHWQDLFSSMRDIRRVVRADGSFVLFTAFPKQMEGYWLNHYFPKMMSDSILQMPDQIHLHKAITDTGWQIKCEQRFFIQTDHCDMFLYCGKHHPERYLDKRIRQGISSFSDLAYESEVDKGLNKLISDIESGEINHIKRTFENTLGDYMLITIK